MGTTLRIAVAAPSRSNGIRAIDDAFAAVRHLDGLLSTWRTDTELARLNHVTPGRAARVSPELFSLLQEAAHWSGETRGAFDPGIGSLVDAWDLRGTGRVPSAHALANARRASGLSHFVLDPLRRTVTRTDSAAWLDSGGFGKGAALRKAARVLRGRGITSARLNFGGQVVVFGPDGGGSEWEVPVAHPEWRDQPAARLHFSDRSASTSSQSERFVTVNGRHLGHIIDPRTGVPVPTWGSVTVVAEDPLAADAVSTALMVLGPDAGMEWARGRSDLGVLFLVERGGRLERRWNDVLEQFLTPDFRLLTHTSEVR